MCVRFKAVLAGLLRRLTKRSIPLITDLLISRYAVQDETIAEYRVWADKTPIYRCYRAGKVFIIALLAYCIVS